MSVMSFAFGVSKIPMLLKWKKGLNSMFQENVASNAQCVKSEYMHDEFLGVVMSVRVHSISAERS